MPRSGMGRGSWVIVFLAISLAVVALYSFSMSDQLVYDSQQIFTHHFLFTQDVPLWTAFSVGFAQDPQGAHVGARYYRPLTSMTFLWEKEIWGIQPRAMRWINLLIFILALYVTLMFLRSVESGMLAPLLTVLLFAFFPLHLDNILWVVGRADLLVFLFGMATLWMVRRYAVAGRGRYVAAALLFFAFGIFSKESMLFFLPVFLLAEYVERRRISLPLQGGLVLVALSFLIVRGSVTGNHLFLDADLRLGEATIQLISTLGYYLKSVANPFYYDVFLTPRIMASTTHLIMGGGASLLLFFMGWRLKRDRNRLFPFWLLVVFLLGHLALVLTSLSPYRASTRFLTMPVLALIWLGAGWISKRPMFLRLAVTVVLLTAFGAAILVNGTAYADDTAFWSRLQQRHPDSPFFITMLAEAEYRQGNIILSDRWADRGLNVKLTWEAAVTLSLIKARIAFARARYELAASWLEKLRNFRADPLARRQADLMNARIYLRRGDYRAAERLLRGRGNDADALRLLYELYLGREDWQEAARLGARLKLLPGVPVPDIRETAGRIAVMSVSQRIDFFARHHNLPRALQLLEAQPKTIARDMKILHLAHLSADTGRVRACLDGLVAGHAQPDQIFRLIGMFYLKTLHRPEEARTYFRRSLKVNPDQPELAEWLLRRDAGAAAGAAVDPF